MITEIPENPKELIDSQFHGLYDELSLPGQKIKSSDEIIGEFGKSAVSNFVYQQMEKKLTSGPVFGRSMALVRFDELHRINQKWLEVQGLIKLPDEIKIKQTITPVQQNRLLLCGDFKHMFNILVDKWEKEGYGIQEEMDQFLVSGKPVSIYGESSKKFPLGDRAVVKGIIDSRVQVTIPGAFVYGEGRGIMVPTGLSRCVYLHKPGVEETKQREYVVLSDYIYSEPAYRKISRYLKGRNLE